MARALIRVVLFFVFLEIFLRIGGAVSLSIQEGENRGNMNDKGAHRIMCIGESTTFSGGKDSYPSQLEGLLNAQGTGGKFEVINRGIPGSSSDSIAANLKKDLDLYNPDMVIAMVGINDTNKTRVYKEKFMTKVFIFMGEIRVYRVWKMLWAHIQSHWENPDLSADEKLKREIKRHPKSSGPYIELGQHLFEEKQYKRAQELFERAVSVNPKKDWGYDQLSKSLILQDKKQEAQDVLGEAIRKNGNRAWSYALLSRFYKDQNRREEAIGILKEGIAKNPGNPELYVELGRLYYQLQEFQLSQKTFESVIATVPNNTKALEELGYCYGEQNRFEEMDAMFMKAAEIDGSSVFLDLSDWYLKHQQAAKAQALLKRTLEIYPQDAKILKGLSNVYREMGNTQAAQEYQDRAEEMIEQKPLAATLANYHKIVDIVQLRGVKMVISSYAMRKTTVLKKALKDSQGIIFIDNQEVFKKALATGAYNDYFADTFAGDFGHCTARGNHLLANDIMKAILSTIDLPKDKKD